MPISEADANAPLRLEGRGITMQADHSQGHAAGGRAILAACRQVGWQDRCVAEEPARQDQTGEELEPLLVSKGYRHLALGLGIPIAVAGIVAVFVSENQAGTAALFVVAIALLLIAVQGTPIAQFGAGENSIQFAATRRRIARELIESGAQETDPAAARAYVDAASVVEPGALNSTGARSISYKLEVIDAVSQIADGVGGASLVGDIRPDVTAVFHDWGEIGLEILPRLGTSPVTFSDVRSFADSVPWARNFPLLVISSAIKPGLESQVEQWSKERVDKPKVGVVQWRNNTNNPALRAALERLRS
ncbi:hypothetical protein IU471_03915 [Nocardia elegans]|uniref:hypothetical protein n=1 Tax=Nocardia elegans TaxID=300029 RepID=UPI001894644B|nr:hypothetical protein [Nocardia elegans]MBF6242728.1 hypothetical protein [Nocardia elegans]